MKIFFSKRIEGVAAVILWSLVVAAYLNTVSPSVGFIDSGELAADVITLGIAHPTGYPLFTLLGRLFSVLPVAGEEIVRLNIFSALLTSLAAAVFFLVFVELLEEGKKERRYSVIIASLVSALALAFSRTFWFQGVAFEVYSLHLLLTGTVMYVFVRAVKIGTANWWLLFAFAVGLSFTNHLTTILLAPAMIYRFFAEHGLKKNAFKRIIVLAIPFCAGLSVYAYLPVRAAQLPMLNWGNPQTVERFWWHVTGKQFRVFMFSSADAAKKQLNYFLNNLPNEFHVLLLVLAAAGFFVMLFADRKKFIFTLLLFITCVVYSINYDIHDIDSYFLLAFVSIAIFAAFGIEKILSMATSLPKRIMVFIALAVLLGIHFGDNRRKVDQSGNYLVEDYTMNILDNLPRHSIVLSYQWDYFVAASYYYQHVQNVRPDVVVIDKELIRRSWYFLQLQNMYPELVRTSMVEYKLFLQELYKFEHELPYDYAAIEGAYTALLKSFMEKNDSVAVYVTPEIEPQYTIGYNRIPEGFLYRVKKDTAYEAVPFPCIRYRDFAEKDVFTRQIKLLMTDALLRREMYEHSHRNDSTARLYRQKASEINPKYSSNVSNY